MKSKIQNPKSPTSPKSKIPTDMRKWLGLVAWALIGTCGLGLGSFPWAINR